MSENTLDTNGSQYYNATVR